MSRTQSISQAGSQAAHSPKVRVRAVLPSEHPPLIVRAASGADVETIATLLDESARAGLTLARSRSELELIWGGFLIVERGGEALGCGALDVLTPALAEVRSVAVSSAAGGQGVGRAVVGALVDRAEALGIDTICLLTRVPGFFARAGFFEVSHETLPANYLELAIRARGRSTDSRSAMMRVLG